MVLSLFPFYFSFAKLCYFFLLLQEIDKALTERTASNLKDRFDVNTMKDQGVGPDKLYDADQEEVMRKIELGLDALKNFVHGVAQNGYGLVIYW